jgi:hypothetical protein
MSRVTGRRTLRVPCPPSWAPARRSQPGIYGRFTWPGCPPTAHGSVMRTPSTRRTRTLWSRRSRAGLGSLTASQRALADFLRVDADLLDVAAETSPALPEVRQDPRALATQIAGIPASEKDRLLGLLAADQATRARTELPRGFRGQRGDESNSPPRRTVAELLDTAWEHRQQRERKAAARRAAEQAVQERRRAEARRKRLDELARDPDAAWAEAERLINTKAPAQYDAAVTLLKDLHELARRSGGQTRRTSADAARHYGRPTLASPASSVGSTAPGSARCEHTVPTANLAVCRSLSAGRGPSRRDRAAVASRTRSSSPECGPARPAAGARHAGSGPGEPVPVRCPASRYPAHQPFLPFPTSPAPQAQVVRARCRQERI